MMIRIEVADMNNIERMLAGFSEDAIRRAIQSALKRTLKGVKPKAAKRVAQIYAIKPSIANAGMQTRVQWMTGYLESRCFRMGLDKFKFTPKKRPKPVRRGNPYLYAEVIRGQGGTLRHAFLANVNGMKIWERKGKRRLPIKRLMGPSVTEMLGRPKVSTFIMAKMKERLQINVMHEVNALLGGFRS